MSMCVTAMPDVGAQSLGSGKKRSMQWLSEGEEEVVVVVAVFDVAEVGLVGLGSGTECEMQKRISA